MGVNAASLDLYHTVMRTLVLIAFSTGSTSECCHTRHGPSEGRFLRSTNNHQSQLTSHAHLKSHDHRCHLDCHRNHPSLIEHCKTQPNQF